MGGYAPSWSTYHATYHYPTLFRSFKARVAMERALLKKRRHLFEERRHLTDLRAEIVAVRGAKLDLRREVECLEWQEQLKRGREYRHTRQLNPRAELSELQKSSHEV